MPQGNKIISKTEKNKICKFKARMLESEEVRASRLEKMKIAAKKRRASETDIEKGERLLELRRTYKRKKENSYKSEKLSNSRRQEIWRLINQNIEPKSIQANLDLETLATAYEKDLTKFKEAILSPIYSNQCSVCGLLIESEQYTYNMKDKIFDPLRRTSSSNDLENWPKFQYDNTNFVVVCDHCLKTLKTKSHNVPRFCRANIPIPDPVEELRGLSFIEQMLISPILPMVFVWRYKTFGQYQSKGQCVAFHNQVQTIAEALPRTLTEVFVNVKEMYGHMDITIRINKLRKALIFLKLNHPAYENIRISEENFKNIEREISVGNEKDNINKETKSHDIDDNNDISASDMIRNAGQNQVLEEHIAQAAVTAPVAVEVTASKEDISKTIKHLFKSISRKDNTKYSPHSTLEGWPLMFPCLLWDGNGGPDSCVSNNVSLREWVNYVIQVPSFDFRKNVIFSSFANILLRRQRITGLTAHKPISSSVEKAVKELIRLSQSSNLTNVPESTLNTLAAKVAAYVDDLPGSLSDMRKFRNDILSMKKKHGPPTFFLTLSSADSMWPEGFRVATKGEITSDQAKNLSVTERANIMAQNPVAFTQAWKKKVQAFLDFVIKGESNPLGEITHYVQKAEWQGRLSEHAHFLFWTKDGVPPLCLDDNGDLQGPQNNMCIKAEALGSAMIHLYPISILKDSSELDDYTFVQNNSKEQSHYKDFGSLAKEDIFKSITQESICFKGYFVDGKAKKSINDLVRSVNLHTCSAYCTNNGKSTCKSRFPFETREQTIIKPIIDKKLNRSYRIHLRRNHPRVNPYSVPVLNLWRANMDLTVLCGVPLLQLFTLHTTLQSLINHLIYEMFFKKLKHLIVTQKQKDFFENY